MSDLITRYWGSFAASSLLCVALQIYGRNQTSKGDITWFPLTFKYLGVSSSSQVTNAKFSSFQINYLIVFLLAMFSDWLQGPYVYELYVSYGFSQQQIAVYNLKLKIITIEFLKKLLSIIT